MEKEENHLKHQHHPIFRQNLTMGQKAADLIANIGGSWWFIIGLFLVLLIWISANTWLLLNRHFDPYPFILLNLFLSCLAAIQAPIILMAQNRQAQRDRIDAKYDHAVNRKAEREIQHVQRELDRIRELLERIKKR